MKSILLLRHAESSRDDSSLKDFDRPLAEGGRKDARHMGVFVKEIEAFPGYIMSSPAKRAKETVQIFAKKAGIDLSLIKWNKDFYSGSARDYLTAIQEAVDTEESILLAGHNPLLEQTASLLCNKEGAYTVRMPTGALVCIEHPAIEWRQVKPGTARLKWMMVPELLEGMS